MKSSLLSVILSLPALCAGSDGFVSLMPKEDVRELWVIEGTPPETWRVENGMIRCTGKPDGFLRSKKVYKNFVFRAEWRFQTEGWKPGREEWPNAGFFINAGRVDRTWPIAQEVQGYFGEAGSLFGIRGGKITGAKRGDFVKNRPPFGSWDRYEITQVNGRVRVVLNGEPVNEGWDAEPSEGNICLQSEGWPVDYRNVEIKELK
jgi:hypothetical protein